MATHDEMHDDDKPIGRILNRREVLKLLGGAGALVLTSGGLARIALAQSTGTPAGTAAATALPGCVVRPALTEGPYFVDEMLNRSDIRIEPSDGSIKAGKMLKLKYHVMQISDTQCTPLEGAQVDIWHCDAAGQYSDVNDAGFSTLGQKWLRGYQVTDASGMAEFVTIYPGWYSGRAVHIHFKIRTDPESDSGYEFTSQLFFPPEISTEVYAEAPYRSKGVTPDTPNDEDGIYQGSGGQTLLELTEDEDGAMLATFDIGLDLSVTQTEVGGNGGPGGGFGGGRPGGAPPNGTRPSGATPAGTPPTTRP